MVKNCDRGLENTARGRRPRAVYGPPSRQITYMYVHLQIKALSLNRFECTLTKIYVQSQHS